MVGTFFVQVSMITGNEVRMIAARVKIAKEMVYSRCFSYYRIFRSINLIDNHCIAFRYL